MDSINKQHSETSLRRSKRTTDREKEKTQMRERAKKNKYADFRPGLAKEMESMSSQTQYNDELDTMEEVEDNESTKNQHPDNLENKGTIEQDTNQVDINPLEMAPILKRGREEDIIDLLPNKMVKTDEHDISDDELAKNNELFREYIDNLSARLGFIIPSEFATRLDGVYNVLYFSKDTRPIYDEMLHSYGLGRTIAQQEFYQTGVMNLSSTLPDAVSTLKQIASKLSATLENLAKTPSQDNPSTSKAQSKSQPKYTRQTALDKYTALTDINQKKMKMMYLKRVTGKTNDGLYKTMDKTKIALGVIEPSYMMIALSGDQPSIDLYQTNIDAMNRNILSVMKV